ncbi:class I SAM-dependent methyltransferase [Paenibacillus cellulositrophicus]
MRIDLGSGNHKFRDCIGIDRIAYPETDLVWDYNQRLPFEDDSVEFVMASRSLEYVDNLQAVMQELYRVCRHKAMVCIVAPYAHVGAHIVNPEYKQLFNEHSPRYWTSSPDTIIDEDEFMLSKQNTWPLLTQGQAAMDFRVLRMEFFYFPVYQTGYDPIELSLLRQSQLNVAHQIMFHLLVVKRPISMEELLLASQTMVFEEPDDVKKLREAAKEKEDGEPLFYMDHMPHREQNRHPGETVMPRQPVRRPKRRKRKLIGRRRRRR